MNLREIFKFKERLKWKKGYGTSPETVARPHNDTSGWWAIVWCVSTNFQLQILKGPLHDPVTWYGIYYTGTRVTQWDFQNKGTSTSPARISFFSKVPLRICVPV